jgi:hapalindole-type alkaloid chlorinase
LRLRSHHGPLFTFLDLHAEDAQAQAGALQAIFEKRLDGLIVRGALAPQQVARAMEVLEQQDLSTQSYSHSPTGAARGHIVGQSLVSAPNLSTYLQDGPAQRARLGTIFGGEGLFEAQMARMFSALAGGLPAGPAPGPEGEPCSAASVRILPDGAEIALHVGNEFTTLAQAAHFRSLMDLSDQLSWFCTLSTPERGGELVVYGLEWGDVAHLVSPLESGAAHFWPEGSAVHQAVTALEPTTFRPGPGDLLIFDGGRYFHRVSKAKGPGPRRTVGGFIGFSQALDRLYIWT